MDWRELGVGSLALAYLCEWTCLPQNTVSTRLETLCGALSDGIFLLVNLPVTNHFYHLIRDLVWSTYFYWTCLLQIIATASLEIQCEVHCHGLFLLNLLVLCKPWLSSFAIYSAPLMSPALGSKTVKCVFTVQALNTSFSSKSQKGWLVLSERTLLGTDGLSRPHAGG